MKKITIALLVISIVAIISCKKNDLQKQDFSNQERFFKLQQNTKPLAKKVADAMQLQNKSKDVVSNIISKAGYPVWNKALLSTETKMIKPNMGNQARDINSSYPIIVIIPLVPTDEQFVNGFLKAEINEDGTIVALYEAKDYNDYSFGTLDGSDFTAEKFAQNIAILDYLVFGYKNFKTTDPRLFEAMLPDGINPPEIQFTINTNNTNSNGERQIYEVVSICFTYQSPHCPSGGNCLGNGCDIGHCSNGECYFEDNTICADYSAGTTVGTGIYIPPEQPTTPIGSPGGNPGGGSGGGNGIIPVQDENIAPKPCVQMQDLGNNNNFTDLFKLIRDYPLKDREYGAGFMLNADGTINYDPIEGTPNDINQGINIGFNFNNVVKYSGFTHNHYSLDQLSVFSPHDIFTLASFGFYDRMIDPASFTFGLTTVKGTNYVIKINDKQKFKEWADNVRDIDNFEGLLVKQFTDFYKITPTNTNAKNEKLFAQYLQQQKAGFSLFRGSPDFKTWKEIEYDNNTDAIVEKTCQ